MPTTKLIYADLDANSNKFWTATQEGSTVTYTWGRVGEAGQSTVKSFVDEVRAVKDYDRKVRSKLDKGYTRQHTVGAEANPVATGNLREIARKQIKHNGDSETQKLIDFLVRRNIHKIEGATNIKWDEASGQLTTPLGPVTTEGLDEAQRLLEDIAQELRGSGHRLTDKVNRYLRIVPQHIGRRKITAQELFPNEAAVRKQKILVDTLRSVVTTATQRAVSDAPEVFKTALTLVPSSDPEFKRVDALFRKTAKGNHTTVGMRLKKMWKVEVAGADAAFEADGAKINNVMELWHGTKDANLLSLLKSGYIIPKQGGTYRITGRAYGDGVYFSDISTKSLNYATDFWGGGRSQRCFMLLNDVAMGKMGNPASRGYGSRFPLPGTDSTFARGGSPGGFINNEMVVYRTSQIRPRYLCEFE